MQQKVQYFDQTSKKYLSEYTKITPEGYSFRIRREKVFSLIPDAKNEGQVLDIGCGPGIMVEGLLEKGYRVHCIDASPQMIHLAKKQYGSHEKVVIEVGDVEKLYFPNNTFQIILAMGLMEYLDDENVALQQIKNALDEKGRIIITFPNKRSPWRIYNRVMLVVLKPLLKMYKFIFKKKPHPITHTEYTTDDVIALLERNGLRTEKIIFYNFKIIPYPFDTLFPRLTVWQSKLFEKFDNTFLRFMGTGFIVQAKKMEVKKTI